MDIPDCTHRHAQKRFYNDITRYGNRYIFSFMVYSNVNIMCAVAGSFIII